MGKSNLQKKRWESLCSSKGGKDFFFDGSAEMRLYWQGKLCFFDDLSTTTKQPCALMELMVLSSLAGQTV